MIVPSSDPDCNYVATFIWNSPESRDIQHRRHAVLRLVGKRSADAERFPSDGVQRSERARSASGRYKPGLDSPSVDRPHVGAGVVIAETFANEDLFIRFTPLRA